MASRRPPLLVRLHGEVVAELTSTGPGQITCHYTDRARERWPLNLPLLSCSLPLTRRPHKDAGPFFRGLLPEGAALAAVAAEARVATFDTFGILARFGRDIAGAAVISPEGEDHGPGRVVDYATGELDADVAALGERPLALHDDSELSLAGLQDKMLLVRTADGWGRPAEGYPSTHILKVEDRRFPGLVAREAACLRLARRVGLTEIEVQVQEFAGLPCLIVSRYDRTVDAGTGRVGRVHQEDVCQALGVDIERNEGRAKYQQYGGPGWRDVARLLVDHSGTVATAQLRQLVRVAAFTSVIGNGDAHGKNLSLLHPEPGVVRLAPLYDTVPTALWPRLPDRAAMLVNGRQKLSGVGVEDLVEEARAWPMSEALAAEAVGQAAEDLLEALADPDLPDDLADLVDRRARALLGR